MRQDILVLGAGMIGVSAALALQARGHRVSLVDRREPGGETSFGNAGIIQAEAVRPYAFPRDLATLLGVLPNHRADIRYRPGTALRNAGSLLAYWHHSAPTRHTRISAEYAPLILGAVDAHEHLIAASGADHLIRRNGYLEVYRREKALQAAFDKAEQGRRQFGVEYRVLDSGGLAAREPGLRSGLAGAIHWMQPWAASDPGALVSAYAGLFMRDGGRFERAAIRDLSRNRQGWRIDTDQGALQGDAVVLALGPWSAQWLAKLGVRVPLFVKRGYHMHYAQPAADSMTNWLLDAEVGYVLAPMRAGIRLTTGAELADLDAPADGRQLAAAEIKARELFPGLGARVDAEPWKGARPCLPDMKPVIGPVAAHPGLWLAFGHGHQGFTLGPITGQILAQMIAGETPALDTRPFRLERFFRGPD